MACLGMKKNFWKDKTILITGHTGFKGSWLSLVLKMKGAEIIGYALPPPTHPSLFEILDIENKVETITGDVRDLNKLIETLNRYKPDIVIHMAAQALVRYSYSNPVETYTTNVIGTVNVLEAIRQTGCVKAALIVTTDKCYENKEWVWGYRENDPLGGFDPYSSSKGCAELVTAAYTNSYFLKTPDEKNSVSVATARAGNVIGGGDWAEDRLIPDIIRAIIDRKVVIIRNPGAIRPWQHVLEPLYGYLCLIEKLWHQGSKFSGGWNFGPATESCQPVSCILESIQAVLDKGFSWQHDKSQNLHEANFLKLDCSKAYAKLGWSPRLDLKTAVEMTLIWYQAYIQKKDIMLLTQQQINYYEALEN